MQLQISNKVKYNLILSEDLHGGLDEIEKDLSANLAQNEYLSDDYANFLGDPNMNNYLNSYYYDFNINQ